MNFNRLFYMNILYECNNDCIFCISHNTKNRTAKIDDALLSIKRADSEYNFSENDIFIVNGGETTISTQFFEIIEFLQSKKMHIVVYTNGRKLEEQKFQNLEMNSEIRWVVPFYGLKELHDYFTNRKGSFDDTFSAIKNFPKIAKKNVCIKFLVRDKNQISDFANLFSELKNDYDDFHISLIWEKENFSQRFEIAKELLSIIETIYDEKLKLKLSNFPICCFSEKIKMHLKNYDENNNLKINKYFFIGNKFIQEYNYDKNHKWTEDCQNCSYNDICPDNYLKYRVFTMEKDKVFLGEE